MKRQEKKQLVVLLTFVCTFALAVLVLVPYFKKLSFYDGMINERIEQAKSLQQQVANKPALSGELVRINSVIEDSKLFMLTSNAQSAGASLLTLLRKTVTDAEGDITSGKVHKEVASAGSTKVKSTFNISNDGFVQVLQQLAASRPVLNITSLRVTPITKREIIKEKGKRRRAQTSETGDIKVVMEVESFFTSGVTK